MPALIRYVCVADHDHHDESAITLVNGLWAYCRHGGGAEGHQWRQITPTQIGELQQLGPSAVSQLFLESTGPDER